MPSADIFERKGLRARGDPVLMLAPMEGLSNPAFRELVCGAGGVDLLATEFIRIVHPRQPAPVIHRHRLPLQIQFMAARPELLAQAIAAFKAAGVLRADDWLDLNAGCPSRRVNAHGAGAALLREPGALLAMLQAMRGEHDGPLSLKMRIGYQSECEFDELLEALREAPLDFVTIHARTRAEAVQAEAPLHTECLAAAVARLPFPVIGNGEVWRVQDALNMLRGCGVRGVMCGRGAIADPFIFRDIRAALRTLPGAAAEAQRREELAAFAAALLSAYRGLETQGRAMIGPYKEFARWFAKNPLVGPEFFERLKRAESLAELSPQRA